METKFKERLFKVHSNQQVGDWQIIVTENEDGTATMQRKSRKVLDGKSVLTTTHYVVGKNIGRANETTPLEQAISEAKSRYNKQLDKGYVVEKPEEGAKVTNALGFIKPMLAQPIEKVKNWTFPVFVQPKFDGHRMLATVKDGSVVLYSRQGKVLDVGHIRSKLQSVYDEGHWDGTTLDGEVYCHGVTLQGISSLVKKPKPESANLDYYLYDIHLPGVSYKYRLDHISLIVEHAKAIYGPNCILLTGTELVENEERLNTLHSEFLSRGFEGTIVRHGEEGYEDGKRSKSLMKKKDFQDAEFRILGYAEGKPYIRTGQVYQVPVYRCETESGATFDCTAPGTMEEKHQQFVDIEKYIGKKLTVKFFNYTPDGVPFLPVALRIREDI